MPVVVLQPALESLAVDAIGSAALASREADLSTEGQNASGRDAQDFRRFFDRDNDAGFEELLAFSARVWTGCCSHRIPLERVNGSVGGLVPARTLPGAQHASRVDPCPLNPHVERQTLTHFSVQRKLPAFTIAKERQLRKPARGGRNEGCAPAKLAITAV